MKRLLRYIWHWLLREARNAPGAWMMDDDPLWRLKGPRSFTNPPPSWPVGYRPPEKDTITMYVIPTSEYLSVHRERVRRARRDDELDDA